MARGRRLGVSLIFTVLNEESSLGVLLDSIRHQTRQPDEIVVVDGGSTDRTVELLETGLASGLPVRIEVLPGANISAGRNRAIDLARGPLIVATDAGVRLSPEWLERLVVPLEAGSADVSAGFFEPDPSGPFESALGATTLPAVSDVRPDRFLPSSRSVAFFKAAWAAVGGYPEWLDYCEDVVFDLALRAAGFRFAFVPAALALFRPRPAPRAFFLQYYRYARGDGKADLFRARHCVRYLTYLAVPVVALVGLRYNRGCWLLLLAGAVAYLRRPYARLGPWLATLSPADRLAAVAWVPAIRLIGDLAKMLGYPVGLRWRARQVVRLSRAQRNATALR